MCGAAVTWRNVPCVHPVSALAVVLSVLDVTQPLPEVPEHDGWHGRHRGSDLKRKKITQAVLFPFSNTLIPHRRCLKQREQQSCQTAPSTERANSRYPLYFERFKASAHRIRACLRCVSCLYPGISRSEVFTVPPDYRS